MLVTLSILVGLAAATCTDPPVTPKVFIIDMVSQEAPVYLQAFD